MARKYDDNFKNLIVNLIVNEGHSTSQTAFEYNVPLKTLEKWITKYNKNHSAFSHEPLSKEEQLAIMKERLKELNEERKTLTATINKLEKDL